MMELIPYRGRHIAVNTYRVTMNSGDIRDVHAANDAAARRIASEEATEEGIRLLDSGEEDRGRTLLYDRARSVRKVTR